MIKLVNVSKQYGDTIVLKDVNLEFNDNVRYVIQGQSGIGKTTLLRLLSKIEDCSSGRIEMDEDTKISYVFQEDKLFPHLSAYKNICFGIPTNSISKDELDQRIKTLSSILKIDSFLSQKASTLSGGQRQRVAIGRALIQNPNVLLMDEALNNLDLELKKEIIETIISLQDIYKFTLIYVTHDEWEAKQLGQEFITI